MRLSDYPLDELHQLCCAEANDTGIPYVLANALYRLHVRLLIALIRAGRRWGRR
jgi:hypothetical protein